MPTLRDLKRADAAWMMSLPTSLLRELCRIDEGLPAEPPPAPEPAAKDYHALSIIEAMDDPELFGSHFEGESWKAWRVFLKALFALPMDEDELAIFRQQTDRTVPPTKRGREAALICGRRGGKSRILALIAVYLACFIDHMPCLATGEIATVAVISADKKQARSVMRYAKGLLEQTHVLASLIAGDTQESVTLTNRVVIEVHTASFKVTRGYTLVAAILDEIAFFPKEDSAAPDVEIARALRPGLATIPHAMVLQSSSPYAKKGLLWDTYRKHFGHNDATVLVWKASTEEMNPRIDPEFLAQQYEDDPASAEAEYGANFRDDVSVFVSREVLDNCTPFGTVEVAPQLGINYSAFVDPSGGSADSMTLAIAHMERTRPVLDAIREVRPPFSPEAVVMEFAALLKSYRVARVTGDRYAGEWPRERFAVHGITYDLAEMTKSQIYQAALPLLNSQKCLLLDHPRLIMQLASLERRSSRGGRDNIDHPPGSHDDVANSAMGVLTMLVGGAAPIVWSPDVLAAMQGMRRR